jgi:hypothetical protein
MLLSLLIGLTYAVNVPLIYSPLVCVEQLFVSLFPGVWSGAPASQGHSQGYCCDDKQGEEHYTRDYGEQYILIAPS